METGVTVALSIFAAIVLIVVVVAVVVASTVSAFEQRPEDGEKE